MSLLERRRALLETAKDAKEGGGINDGKYVVIRGERTLLHNSSTAYSASIDYGMSFATITGYGRIPYMVGGKKPCAEYLNSSGEFVYCPSDNNNASNTSLISLSTMSSPSDITACNTGSVGYNPPTDLSPGAWCFSTDTTRAVRLALSSNYAASGLEVGSYLNNTYNLDSKQHLTLPRWAQGTKLNSTNGPYLKFNSDTLKVGFLGENAGASIGLAGPITCSITTDGGHTWTDVRDIVIENSQSLGEHGFISSHMSNNGKNIGIVYQPKNSEPKLIVSNDYGNTFNSVNIPSGESYLDNFETSAKFKTWYLGSHNSSDKAVTSSVWKSENRGQTWTRVLYREDAIYVNRPCSQSCFHCDDSGTRLVLMSFSSTSTRDYHQYVSYSLDGGNTWTGAVENLSRNSYTSSNFYMSRDSYNIQ